MVNIAHMVKCTVCGDRFDRDKVQAVKVGARRYAHYRCMPEGELAPLEVKEIDPDLVALKDYIKELLKDDYVEARVNKQIKDFQQEYGYTYSGMLKSLIYFYEVKGNSTEKANGGIGIVPFVYKDAYRYYYSIFLAKNQNKEKDLSIFQKSREVVIKPPTLRKKIKLFFDSEDIENEE